LNHDECMTSTAESIKIWLKGSHFTTGAGVFLLSIIFHLTGIYINTTPSFPVGFYKIVDEPAGRGAYVSFCPPQDEVFDMAVARHTINTGNCPGGYGMLLKRVLAQGGDSVSINKAGIKVNGELLPNSAQLKTDIDGSKLPQYHMGARILDDSE
jgi:conjugative transfer signal peptidase TraF